MEDHNHLPEHLDDPPPRRNDREAAEPEGENNGAHEPDHIAVHNGAHEPDHLDPLIGDFDAPHLHFQSRSAINPTRPQNESFKISPHLINLVKENQFHGFATEIPIAHIDLFEEICDTTSSDEEANNYRKSRSLISNLAVSDNNNLLDPSLTMDKEAIQLSRFDDLMEMMNTAVKCLQEVTSSSSEDDDDFYGREEDVNYMGARRGYQGRGSQCGFPNPIPANQNLILESLMEEIEASHQVFAESVNKKIQEMYEEINNKVVSLSDKVEGIYKQNRETAFFVETYAEPFMRKYEKPLYAHLNAITLRSGTAYKEPVDPRYQEEEQPLPHPRPGRRPATGEEQPKPALSARPVTSPPVTGGHPSDQTDHSTPADGDVADEPLDRDGVTPTPPLQPERVYQPKVPYPNTSKTSKKERERAKLKELIGQLTVRLPFIEACAMIPTLRKYMKSILTTNISLEDGVMMITQDCSAILQNRSPQKRGDPGSFVLSCTIGEEVFERCLCDLGSSINMMPLSTAKRLGHHSFKPTKISLVLADRSIRRPIGVLLDIPITIGECQIPTDFVVLEVEKEPKDPLILGRPFLSTAGAIIDVSNGKIDLHLGDFLMKFDMNETLKQASSHNQVFSVDKVEEATNELCEEIILDDAMEIALTEAKDDYVFLMESVENSAKILDSAECY
ncbi:unnamed protein product, partial [Arabidopsis halleri]